MRIHRRRGLLALAGILPFLLPTPSGARCRAGAELVRLSTALGREQACRALEATGGDRRSCRDVSVPSCGASAVAALRELTPVADASLGDFASSGRVRRCEVAILRATGQFVERRLLERAREARRTRLGRSLGRIATACDAIAFESAPVSASGRDGLRVAAACAPPTSASPSTVSGPALERCLRASLERIVDDVAPQPLRPSIVLILTDDQRWDTMGVMPATFARLAGEGLAFENAFATTPSCSPSRASLLTGRISRRHGVVSNGRETKLDPTRTIATALHSAGYATGYYGKYLNGAEALGPGVPPGWDDWHVFLEPSGGSYGGSRVSDNGVFRTLGEGEYSTDAFAEGALQFVRRHASEPFFLVYAPFAPHDPSEPAPRHRGKLAHLPPHRPPNWQEAGLSSKPSWVQFMARIANPLGALRRDQQRIHQLETLLAVDEAVAAITRQLERAGLTDQTVVVYTSDHGLHWGEHWSSTKFSAYEESIRVPLFLRYPARIPRPQRTRALVANIDIAPTLAELAGASLPGPIDGASLVALFGTPAEGRPAVPWRTELAIESPGGLITSPSRALRTDRWKYIEIEADGGVRRELYDLTSDRWELRNRAFDPAFAPIRAELAGRLAEVLP